MRRTTGIIRMCRWTLVAALMFGMNTLWGQTPSTAFADIYSGVSMDSLRSTREKLQYPRFAMGIYGAMVFNRLNYTDKAYSFYDHIGRKSGAVGLFMQVPLGTPHLVVRPEVVFTGRGDSLVFDDVHYGIVARYLDLRMPLIYRYPIGAHFAPYLMIVPHYDFTMGGRICYADKNTPDGVNVKVTDANMQRHDYGLMLGGGFEFRIDFIDRPVYVMIEGAYNFGLQSTFSDREVAGNASNSAIANNFLGSKLWKGSRHNRGVEVGLRVTVPLDGKFVLDYYRSKAGNIPPMMDNSVPGKEKENEKKDNGNGGGDAGSKDNAASTVTPPTPTVVKGQTVYLPGDTIKNKVTYIVDTVYVFRTDTVRVGRGAQDGDYHTKDCYSILDIQDYIYQGVDISDKRICMFDINFDFDSYTIPYDAEDVLKDMVRMMLDYPDMTIEVYGHTDGLGTEEYNQRLSERRAGAVADYLFKHGVEKRRVRTFGMGELYPIASEDTEDGCFRNRRVEIEVTRIGRKYRRGRK